MELVQIFNWASRPGAERGQIAVSILLIMAVLVVISYGLARRTTSEIALTTQTKESTAVFNAAESGVNQALADIFTSLESGSGINSQPQTESIDVDGDGTDDVEVVRTSTESNSIEMRVNEGMSLSIVLENNSGSLSIAWGKEANCNDRASLLITTIGASGGETTAKHVAVGCHGDDFAAASGASDTFQNTYSLAITNSDTEVRIKPVFAPTTVRVTGSNLPTQAFIAEARAKNLLGDNQETRAVRVVRSQAAAPSILDYAVYSNGSISK